MRVCEKRDARRHDSRNAPLLLLCTTTTEITTETTTETLSAPDYRDMSDLSQHIATLMFSFLAPFLQGFADVVLALC